MVWRERAFARAQAGRYFKGATRIDKGSDKVSDKVETENLLRGEPQVLRYFRRATRTDKVCDKVTDEVCAEEIKIMITITSRTLLDASALQCFCA